MNSKSIDEEIRAALSSDDALALEKYSEEQNVLQQAMSLLTGKNRWLNLWMMLVTFAFLGLTIYCGWRFYGARDMKELIGWSVGIILSFGTISILKIWAWMEMEKNSTVREIKRLELQVAMLSKKLGSQESGQR